MKCCICGTVRNCGQYLDKIFENMETIGSQFDEYKIMLYYDNSNDDTLYKLKEYKNKNQNLIFFVNKSPLLPYRTHRIALGRNVCLNFIRQNCSDYEYFIMMDCDDRCSYNIDTNLLNNILKRTDWDALSFCHPAGYYDTWALSKRPFVLSCHNFKNFAHGQNLINKIIEKTPKDQLIPCLSAFNGIAIYRTNKFINCLYDGRFRLDYIPFRLIKENIRYAGKINLRKTREDCEHRYFHFQGIIKNNARIRILPQPLLI
jgi:hypothetical protein